MKLLKKTALGLLILFLLAQFIRPPKNKSSVVLSTDIQQLYSIPANVQALLKAACYDCHSNNTIYPWYANIQPMAWNIHQHVTAGKEELNFNEFGTYSKKKRKSKLKSIASQVKDGDMPLRSYQWLHAGARLDSTEKKIVTNWVWNTTEKMDLQP